MAIGSQALFLIFERSSHMLTHGIFHHILPILQITMPCFWDKHAPEYFTHLYLKHMGLVLSQRLNAAGT